MSVDKRFSLLGIIGGLMVSENLGDVHDEINHLCDLAGIPRPEGSFEEGWTEQDWQNCFREQAQGEPCPNCGCPGAKYDGHACEDYEQAQGETP